MRKNKRKSGAKAALAGQTNGIEVLAELAALKSMTVPELQGKWRVVFGEPAPNASRGKPELRIGDRIQELAHGGIKPATRRTLDPLAAEVACGALGPLIGYPRRPITCASGHPKCCAASSRPWPAMISPSSAIKSGDVKPYSTSEAAILAI